MVSATPHLGDQVFWGPDGRYGPGVVMDIYHLTNAGYTTVMVMYQTTAPPGYWNTMIEDIRYLQLNASYHRSLCMYLIITQISRR